MSNNQNAKITNEVKRAFGLNNMTGYPMKVSEAILPVVDVNPRYTNIIGAAPATNATSGTPYTTPANKDFYLTGFTISLIKDVTSTSTATALMAYINGVQVALGRIAGITLTAQNDSLSASFPFPLKIDRNTAITITNTTNVANIAAYASIYGYLVDNVGD